MKMEQNDFGNKTDFIGLSNDKKCGNTNRSWSENQREWAGAGLRKQSCAGL